LNLRYFWAFLEWLWRRLVFRNWIYHRNNYT
jgi:hypothetical protein